MNIQKILKYDIYAETSGTERYNRVCGLLEQAVEPSTLSPDMLDCKGKVVFVSPQLRATTCVKTLSAKSITLIPDLKEIAFRLNDFCSEKDFLMYGSSAVRTAFIKAFETNQLLISHSQIKNELENIILLKQPDFHSPLCISHTFRMKLLEIYSLIGEDLFNEPSIINKYINPNKHLYNFGETIEV